MNQVTRHQSKRLAAGRVGLTSYWRRPGSANCIWDGNPRHASNSPLEPIWSKGRLKRPERARRLSPYQTHR